MREPKRKPRPIDTLTTSFVFAVAFTIFVFYVTPRVELLSYLTLSKTWSGPSKAHSVTCHPIRNRVEYAYGGPGRNRTAVQHALLYNFALRLQQFL